jgi:hypothetical protein
MATLSQGPQPQFRNMLADAIRDYTPTLANRLNDPTSGAGLAVDAVGGLADMLIGQPYRSMNNLLSRPYVSGDPQAAEDAFNVAGAAMTGGLLAPRPRNSLGSGGRVTPAAEMPGTAGSNRLQEGSAAPTQPPSPQTGGGLLARMPDGSPRQPVPAPHTNWLSDPVLADIATRYELRPDGALSEHVARAISGADGTYEYGIRTTPYKVDPGKTMPDSTQWYQDADPVPWRELTKDDRMTVRDAMDGQLSMDEIKARSWDPNYLDHGEPLGGASAIGILRPDTPPNVAAGRGYESYGSDGDFVHLIRSRYGKDGYDSGERILSDAEVVAVVPYGPNLYANGGRPGALAGLLSGYGYQQQNQLATDWTSNLRPGDIL